MDWPVSVICSNSLPDIESVTEALRTGPYGRCVYKCDNDVCSNQVPGCPSYIYHGLTSTAGVSNRYSSLPPA